LGLETLRQHTSTNFQDSDYTLAMISDGSYVLLKHIDSQFANQAEGVRTVILKHDVV
jgi:hypothetical protein